jgi:transcription-repair coupling factor (superfamily II helicase)
VRFSDLGLLVLDEEQRFGVEHKEKTESVQKRRQRAQLIGYSDTAHASYGA